jgi:hypothetical protein
MISAAETCGGAADHSGRMAATAGHVPAMNTINSAYPWGRSFDEYRRMFRLSDADLGRRILGCADGPAAFNAGVRRRGGRVVSCDPLYRFAREEIRARIDAVQPELVAVAERERERFVWDQIRSPAELGRVRMAAMGEFLADYRSGHGPTRYVAGSLPRLPFAARSFDLALCSHFLFLYSDELPLDFHLRSLLELCRVAAAEVRVFPLVDLQGRPSRHAGPASAELARHGLRVSVERVPYEFQRGGNEMMRIVTGG